MYQRLRDLRKKQNLKQTAVAEVLHISRVTYYRYEKGVRDIPVMIIIDLAKFYGTSVDYLLDLTDDPEPYRK